MRIILLVLAMICGSVFAYPNNFYEYNFTGNIAIIEGDGPNIYRAHKFTHNSLHPNKSNQTHAFVIEEDLATYETYTSSVSRLVEPFITRGSSCYIYCDSASTNEFSHWTLNDQIISTSPTIKINFGGNVILDTYDYEELFYVDGKLYEGYYYDVHYDEFGMPLLSPVTIPLFSSFSDISLEAHYSASGPIFRMLDISISGNGMVSQTNGSYAAGTNLYLSAIADQDWLFMGWNGDISGDYTESNKVITLNEDMNIIANFSLDADGDGFNNTLEKNLGMNERYAETAVEVYNILSNEMTTMISTNDALEMIKDLRVGSQTFGVSNGNATIRMYVDESSDLTSTWSNTQHVLELDIPADADTKFYRFRMD